MTALRKRMAEDLQLKGYASGTQELYLNAVSSLAKHCHKSPDLITEEELRAYFLFMKEQKQYARSTTTIMLCGIKFFFQTTLQKTWPVLALVRPAKEKRLPVVLSRQEVKRIVEAVRTPVYRVCLSTIYTCGLRISEGIGLQVPHVDSQRMLLRVVGKGNKERFVPLAPATLERLRALWRMHRSEPWLFPAHLQPGSRRPTQAGPIGVKNLRRAFAIALRESRVTKPACVHSLRHAYATHLLEAKVNLRVIQEILGHGSPSTTALYTHLTEKLLTELKAPVDQLARGL
jgi:integrase/recombinase XerD